ncbi:cytochrome c-type biogenesis protein [Erythrobacter alti]|uniref:cytochrome c-type biogenesis protein n=1 Tax=Erythrobacter alti TaxID=1896145 RepID=UPI003BF5043C
MKLLRPYFFLLVLVFAPLATPAMLSAQTAVPPAPYAYTQLDDPRQEAAARELMATLRCLQCQSQSIADSDAPVAGDMRHQVRVRIAAGESPDEVRDYLVSRYGDYISYEPQVSATTWPLFAVPVLLILLAGLVMWRRIGRRGEAE